MATIQQSIEIRVPVQTAYNQLTQFEEYPRFMEQVETVRQTDDAHMHWTSIMANRPVEWDAEITEQQPDRCIAWRNISGPTNSGKVEVQPAGPDTSRVTFTLESKPEQVPGSLSGDSEQEMAQRLRQDLARLKDFIEARGTATGAWRGEIHAAQVTLRDRDARARTGGEDIGKTVGQTAQEQQDAARSGQGGAATSGYAAGSEGWDGTEDPTRPVVSSASRVAAVRNDSAGSVAPQEQRSTQSPSTLSEPAEGVAEEVSFDQQSDTARHVGQMPQDPGASAAEALAKSLQQDEQQEKEAKLKPSIDRAVPPSE